MKAEKPERRILRRLKQNSIRMTFELHSGGKSFSFEVVNFHFQGACIYYQSCDLELLHLVESGQCNLDFYIGDCIIAANLRFALKWTKISDVLIFGVSFPLHQDFNELLDNSLRTNGRIRPSIVAEDPLDPIRNIFFSGLRVGESHMLLATSITNRHIFPGMILKRANVALPLIGQFETDLHIDSVSLSEEHNEIHLAVSFIPQPESSELLSTYMTSYCFSSLRTATKKVKGSLTFRVISDEVGYQDVLHLRYRAYQFNDKVVEGLSPSDLGEGLAHEGEIVAGYLNGKLVAAMELRLSNSGLIFRAETSFGRERLMNVMNLDKIVEINKLAVLPCLQGTDVVVGMIQKVHAYLLNLHGYSVVISVTTTLVPFYKRLGYQHLGLEAPHPYLPETLHLMGMDASTYRDGKGLRRTTWDFYYSKMFAFYERLESGQERGNKVKETLWIN